MLLDFVFAVLRQNRLKVDRANLKEFAVVS